MAEFRVVPGHTITTGNGPAETGGWPFISCECGEFFINKSAILVLEAMTDHLNKVEGITE